jgi:hypothetical protein
MLPEGMGTTSHYPIELPPLDERGQMLLTTEEIVGVRERRLRSRMVREYRVKWRDWPTEDATWEREHILQRLGLQLLEDKQSQGGRTVMSPPL